ncbi:MAG: hypothetical protein M3N16_03085 [Actinomycetota bacterium]|nr:hypothetical protein [Actinomycetota bacterium]
MWRRPVLEVGPAAMPAIPWITPRPGRRGHPGVGWADIESAACAAWLADIRGWSRRRIGQHLFEVSGAFLADRGLRRKANRYTEAGRQALCDHGVWPWVSVPLDRVDDEDAEGELPDGWWLDDDVLAHLEVWYRCAEHGRTEPEGSVEQANMPPLDSPLPGIE